MEGEDQGSTVSIRIPFERLGVIIGKSGSVKNYIEETGQCSIVVDSEGSEVFLKQDGDPMKFLAATEVVKAIGRGFNPDRAYTLFSENYQLIIMPLRDVARKGSNRIKDIKGRVIGKDGKTRRIIEDLTDTMISVYGDTVSVIGDYVSVKYSIEALQMLISGKKQRTVYSFLETRVRDMKFEKLNENFP
ncbi:MAG: KH domain-containing protein [Candidatus Thermoplasmatota archaeon]|jgi:ribosomal RNA assembly protein|nr:KH domain-containing protein [Candidatus Thermoplasmatota archaeon]MCL5987551.1 KH domain-containing protein [Candidatus Thermoplasmatota archaeon]